MAIFARKPRRRFMADINVVPYIDVMLVLLIVFMVTTPLLMQGVKVELPQAPAEAVEDTDNEPLIVSVKPDGSLYLSVGGDPEEAKSLEAIQELVSRVLAEKPQTPVMVWGDRQVDYGTVVVLMAGLQAAGAANVGLITEPPGAR